MLSVLYSENNSISHYNLYLIIPIELIVYTVIHTTKTHDLWCFCSILFHYIRNLLLNNLNSDLLYRTFNQQFIQL